MALLRKAAWVISHVIRTLRGRRTHGRLFLLGIGIFFVFPINVWALPDLIPKTLSLSSASITAGGSLTVTVTVKNQGTTTAAATTMIRINNTAGSSNPSDPIQQGIPDAIDRGRQLDERERDIHAECGRDEM